MTASHAGALRPAYYVGRSGLQPIDVIRDWSLGFDLGNACKYLLRAGRKGPPAQDLRKALTYLEFARDQIRSGDGLAEWRARRPSRIAPIHASVEFGLDDARATALACIHDLSRGSSLAGYWIDAAMAHVTAALIGADPPGERAARDLVSA